jgi:hypothetical protein
MRWLALVMQGQLATGVAAEADICVAIHGSQKVQKGSALCTADETSRALAIGATTQASALIDSSALARGAGSQASAEITSSAIATDGGSAFSGDHSSATANGEESEALAMSSSSATATDGGNAGAFGSSQAMAKGEDSEALANTGSTAIVEGAGSIANAATNSLATATDGDDADATSKSIASAEGAGSIATAEFGIAASTLRARHGQHAAHSWHAACVARARDTTVLPHPETPVMTIESTVVGEHREDPSRFLVIGTDGQYYGYDPSREQLVAIEPDARWELIRGDDDAITE